MTKHKLFMKKVAQKRKVDLKTDNKVIQNKKKVRIKDVQIQDFKRKKKI